MSTELGTMKGTGSRKVDMDVTRFHGGDAGPCVQLTSTMENGMSGYVQLSARDILSLLPVLKREIIDPAFGNKVKEYEAALAKCHELRKTIFAELAEINKRIPDIQLDLAVLSLG